MAGSNSRERNRSGGGGGGAGRTYWLVTTSLENFQRTRDHGFRAHGVRSRQKKKIEKMRPGDRILFYVVDARAFAAVASVTQGYHEDHRPIWVDRRAEEDFPHRVGIRADHVLDESVFIDALQLAPRMEYVKRWPPEDWPLAFLGETHVISGNDFALVEGEVNRIRDAASAPTGPLNAAVAPKTMPSPEPPPVAKPDLDSTRGEMEAGPGPDETATAAEQLPDAREAAPPEPEAAPTDEPEAAPPPVVGQEP